MHVLCTQFEKFKGYMNVSAWNNHMEIVRGTDGSRFHPWIQDNDTLTVWVNELFRAIDLMPNKTTEMDGIRLRRYELVSDEMLWRQWLSCYGKGESAV